MSGRARTIALVAPCVAILLLALSLGLVRLASGTNTLTSSGGARSGPFVRVPYNKACLVLETDMGALKQYIEYPVRYEGNATTPICTYTDGKGDKIYLNLKDEQTGYANGSATADYCERIKSFGSSDPSVTCPQIKHPASMAPPTYCSTSGRVVSYALTVQGPNDHAEVAHISYCSPRERNGSTGQALTLLLGTDTVYMWSTTPDKTNNPVFGKYIYLPGGWTARYLAALAIN